MTIPLLSPPARQPLYLFADSQLLFWKPQGKLLLEGVVAGHEDQPPAAAYIGASNGDREEFILSSWPRWMLWGLQIGA
jgi:hypothetical protein